MSRRCAMDAPSVKPPNSKVTGRGGAATLTLAITSFRRGPVHRHGSALLAQHPAADQGEHPFVWLVDHLQPDVVGDALETAVVEQKQEVAAAPLASAGEAEAVEPGQLVLPLRPLHFEDAVYQPFGPGD